jgi:hypothetical protein
MQWKEISTSTILVWADRHIGGFSGALLYFSAVQSIGLFEAGFA